MSAAPGLGAVIDEAALHVPAGGWVLVASDLHLRATATARSTTTSSPGSAGR